MNGKIRLMILGSLSKSMTENEKLTFMRAITTLLSTENVCIINAAGLYIDKYISIAVWSYVLADKSRSIHDYMEVYIDAPANAIAETKDEPDSLISRLIGENIVKAAKPALIVFIGESHGCSEQIYMAADGAIPVVGIPYEEGIEAMNKGLQLYKELLKTMPKPGTYAHTMYELMTDADLFLAFMAEQKDAGIGSFRPIVERSIIEFKLTN